MICEITTILNKLGPEYSVYVSMFHSKWESFLDWKLPSLDSFFESLIKEQDKLIRIGVIQTSKDQDLLVIDSSKAQEKGKSKKREPKEADSKPKQNQQAFEGASGSKKRKFGKRLCPYCENGFHLEDRCMRKKLDEMSSLLKHHNIVPPRENNPDEEAPTEDAKRCHALNATLYPSLAYIRDSGASNHMVSSK